MIIKDFNQGWGDDVPLRMCEKQILSRHLRTWYCDKIPRVLINSTWYSADFHASILAWLEQNEIREIGLVSMLDPPIPNSDWFSETGIPVRSIGYYRGSDEIDFWALIVDRELEIADLGCDADMIDTPFLCFNRKPHPHRVRLVNQLSTQPFCDRGIITLGNHQGPARGYRDDHDRAGSALAPNPGADQYGIPNDIMTLGPMSLWNRCFLNLVTETVFDVDAVWFASEKIYKPIMGMRPFLVYAPGGATAWLEHVGIESYVDDFQDISSLDLRDPNNLPGFVSILCQQPRNYLMHKYLSLIPKIQHNRRRFQFHVDRTWQRWSI